MGGDVYCVPKTEKRIKVIQLKKNKFKKQICYGEFWKYYNLHHDKSHKETVSQNKQFFEIFGSLVKRGKLHLTLIHNSLRRSNACEKDSQKS